MSRVRLAVAAVTLVAATVIPLAAASPAGAAPTCPTGQVPFASSFSNGSLKLGKLVSSSGLTGQASGCVDLSTLPTVATAIAPEDVTFAPATIKILFLSVPASISIQPPGIVGTGTLDPATFSLSASLKGTMAASAKLLGFTCTMGPLTPTLTTGNSGSMTGTPMTPTDPSNPLALAGKVVANDFTVPAMKPSSSCPGLIAGLSNLLIGLPAAPGKASISFDVTFGIG